MLGYYCASYKAHPDKAAEDLDSALNTCRVTALYHEAFDISMELGVIVGPASSQAQEILCHRWRQVTVQLCLDVS